MVIWAGPDQYEVRLYPCSIAAVGVIGLKADPACRREGGTARFSLLVSSLGSGPPTMARISPLLGSIATTAADGSVLAGRSSATAASAACCIRLSRLVWTRSPPVYVSSSPSLSSSQRRV